jgi:adenylosuccinate synthase
MGRNSPVSLVNYGGDFGNAWLVCSFGLATANLETLERVEVSYAIIPSWTSIAAVSSYYEDLPENCKKYITFIEEYLNERY